VRKATERGGGRKKSCMMEGEKPRLGKGYLLEAAYATREKYRTVRRPSKD